MTKLRLIPKLQLKPSESNLQRLVLVVSKQFNAYTEIGDPVSQAKIFQDQAADELCFVNIDKNAKDELPKLAEVIKKVSEVIFMPLTVGGGVRSIEDFRLLLNNGADKVLINTIAYEHPNLIKESAETYGTQCVVISIDFKLNKDNKVTVFTNCGTLDTGISLEEWALKVESLGAGELLLTSIDNDGTRSGLALEQIKKVVNLVKIPVIASGGCGLAKHFVDGFLHTNCSAVSAGNFFAHRDQNFIQTRSQIFNAGINIRLHK
jgi:imidazole glycerol-phosphate synthase subunit HisF